MLLKYVNLFIYTNILTNRRLLTISEWNRTKCGVSLGDISKGRKKTLSETSSMPIIQYSNEPKDILSSITYYDCHYGPQRHVKEKERYNRK